MNHSICVEATLLATSHPHIAKHTNIVSIVISAIVGLGGMALMYFSLDMDASSSTVCMSLLTVGAILVLVALYRLFWKSTVIVYTPTGSTIREGSRFSDSDDLDVLQRLMEKKNFGQLPIIAFKPSGNGRLDYMVSKDGQFAAVQLFRFVPYTYEPISEIYYYTDADAKAFQHYLETHNH